LISVGFVLAEEVNDPISSQLRGKGISASLRVSLINASDFLEDERITSRFDNTSTVKSGVASSLFEFCSVLDPRVGLSSLGLALFYSYLPIQTLLLQS